VNNARASSGFLTGRFTKIVRILVSPDVKAWSSYRVHPARESAPLTGPAKTPVASTSCTLIYR
jgi:hypothetical protein